MDIATAAAVFITGASAGALGMAFRNTVMAGKGEETSNPCDDACTIARLNEDVAYYWSRFYAGKLRITALSRKLRTLEAENADFRIDIAAKAQRLAEAGLQSSGGIDPTVSA